MIIKNLNKSLGEISKGLLIFGGIIVVAIIITFIVIKLTTKPPEVVLEEEAEGEKIALPVYEVDVEKIKFNLIESNDLGNVLPGIKSIYPQWQKDLTTTERFVQVIIGAVNTGTEYIEESAWDVGEIIDKDGRKFLPLREAEPWLPEDNQCGVLLKPGFAPRECVKIYEVAEISSNLKIKVFLPKKTGIREEQKEALIDLDL